MGDAKTPHKPSTHVNFHYFAIGDLIKASSHQFGFGDTPNGPSNDDLIDKYNLTDNDGDTSMILTNPSNRDKVSPTDISKVLYIPNPYSKQDMKEITIVGKLYFQVNTSSIYVPPQNRTHC